MDKIICIGKNYLDHAKELGDAIPDTPIVFLKPPSCLIRQSAAIALPKGKGEVHHELEIVLKLSNDSYDKPIRIKSICLGLDLTLRSLQKELKSKGLPWERAKAFPESAILTDWISGEEFLDYLKTPFYLKVNGELKQRGVGTDMRWSPSEILEMISKDFLIMDGDILFTGTPKGVGPLHPGDELEIGFEGREPQKFIVENQAD